MTPIKPTLYLESTIPSYLTARRPSDLISVARQAMTQDWWERDRKRYDIYVSDVVVREISRGDELAAIRRVKIVIAFPMLERNPEVNALAKLLLLERIVPEKSVEDATHLALACYHEIDIVCTWNFKHMANKENRKSFERFCRERGIFVPAISTPEELLESDQ